jgi:hypothetical protein
MRATQHELVIRQDLVIIGIGRTFVCCQEKLDITLDFSASVVRFLLMRTPTHG